MLSDCCETAVDATPRSDNSKICSAHVVFLRYKLHCFDPCLCVSCVCIKSQFSFLICKQANGDSRFHFKFFLHLTYCLLLSFCFFPTLTRWGTYHTKWRRSFGEWAASGLRASAELQPGLPASPCRTGVGSSIWGTLLIRGAPNHRDHGWDR